MNDTQIAFTQRYYHFIVLRGNKEIIKRDFFRQWRISLVSKSKGENDSTFYHYNISTDIQFYRGDLGKTQNKDAGPPFIFDIIIIDCSNIQLTILGFPFKRLAVDLVTSLTSTYNVLSRSNFIKVDMA